MAKRAKDGSCGTAYLLSPRQHKHNMEVKARRREVSAAMINGVFGISELHDIARNAGYVCTFADIQRDIASVKEDWRETAKSNADTARQIHEAQLWNIYNALMVGGNLAEARKTIESIRAMNGTDAPIRTKNQTEVSTSISQEMAEKLSKALFPDGQ